MARSWCKVPCACFGGSEMSWIILPYILIHLAWSAFFAVIKRPAVDNSIVLDPAGKRLKLEATSTVATSYKSRLNEFCQKFRLSIPSYDTDKVENGKGFLTTVVFNKKVYKSNGPQPTKKQSEQNAAQVVLHFLNQCPPPAPSYQDYMEQCKKLTSGQDQPSESIATEASTTAVTTTSKNSSILNYKTTVWLGFKLLSKAMILTGDL